MTICTTSPKQTQDLAARLAKTSRGGEVIALQGELGSGKTTFVQGFARAHGVRRPVRSPTFVFVQTYKLPATSSRFRYLCHIDAYRLVKKNDHGDLGLHDFMGKPETVTVIEWPERIKNILPRKTIWIRFAHGKNQSERVISF